MLTAPQTNFIKQGKEIARKEGARLDEVFIRFLAMAFHATVKPTRPIAQQEDEEKKYMAVVGALRHKDSPGLMALMLADMVTALEENQYSDFLGPVFMECLANSHLGQFFTPYDLSYMMAKAALGDVKTQVQEAGYITASEPSAGSGGMVLAACKYMAEEGCTPALDIIWEVRELDVVAYHACYLQLTLNGVNAVLIHGNTLTLETYDTAITLVRAMHPKPFTARPAPLVFRERKRRKK